MQRYSSPTNRKITTKHIIIFLDIDCYEVQVWLDEFRPDLIGKDVPIVVVNHDERILSVNYTAKSMGVERGDWQSLRDARSQCRSKGKKLIEIEAGERFGKVDTFLPQVESDKILKAIQNYQHNLGRKSSSIIIQRSSRDEFYLDVTDLIQNYHSLSSFKIPSSSETLKLTEPRKRNLNDKYHGKPTTIMETWEREPIFGLELFNRVQAEGVKSIEDMEELSLVHGAIIAQKLINIINKETGYEASAGIAHSKLVAKLACSRNKPEGITIIANSSHQRLQKQIPFQDLPGFGSVTGERIKEYYENRGYRRMTTIDELLTASNDGEDLDYVFEKLRISDREIGAEELDDYCHFRDDKSVMPVVHQKTFSTSVSFKGDESWDEFKDKIYGLSKDMQERIEYNNNEGRKAKELVVKATLFDDVSANLSSDGENTMRLGRNLCDEKIYSHIRNYCKENHLYHQDIYNICLTAKNILHS